MLPTGGSVYISVNNADKKAIVPIARQFAELGFELMGTEGTRQLLAKHGVEVQKVYKLAEGRPNIRDFIKNGQIQVAINTPTRASGWRGIARRGATVAT